jgi:ornithine decarboxylase
LGLKYGATQDECYDLIDHAKQLKLDIVGTSFHVGSFSKDPIVFKRGIEDSYEILKYAKKKGFMNCHLLDIGGGFTKDNFKDCADVINKAITNCFGEEKELKIIAEPGRFFAEQVFTFFVPVIGSRKRNDVNEYWIADSLYGSYNCIIYDGQEPSFTVFRNPLLGEYDGSDVPRESIIHLATCDSFDTLGIKMLPYMRNGDFIMNDNFGAYTLSGSCNFNGINMTNVPIYYVK